MLHFLGLTLMVASAVIVAPAPISIIFGEIHLAPSFLIPAAASLLIGFLLYRRFDRKKLTFGRAMVIAALAWLIVPLLGGFPFLITAEMGYLEAHNIGFLESFFESMSGFTTTGLTMFEMPDIENGIELIDAPHTILLWRSLMQWVGGIGVMVLFLSAIIGAGKVAKQLYSAEGGGGRAGPDVESGPEATIRASAKSIYKIYLFYTLLAFLILYLLGMDPFQSINHAMTALATGGFSVNADSFTSYGVPILIFTILPMMAGATSFAVHRRFMAGNWKALFRSLEFKLMIFLIVLVTILLGFRVGWADSIFNVTSAATGTGFSSVNVIGEGVGAEAWGTLDKGLLSLLMISGGGYGSTAGALKLIRIVILFTALYWLVKKALLPDRAVVPLKVGDRVFSEEEVLQSAVFIFAYLVLLAIGTVITIAAVPEAGAMDAFFESTSAQGTVGLSTGITGSDMPNSLKITYIIQMWIGRLEVIPAIALVANFIGVTPRRRDPF